MARFTVKDNTTGKRYNSLKMQRVAEIMKVDPDDANWAMEEHGKVDTDTHTATQQSKGKPGFAFSPK